MNGILQSIQQKAYEFTFHGGLIRFDRAEVTEIEDLIQKAEALSDALEPIISDIQTEAEDMESDLKTAINTLTATKTLCEINELPEHFKTAFLENLNAAIIRLADAKNNSIQMLSGQLASELFKNGVEV